MATADLAGNNLKPQVLPNSPDSAIQDQLQEAVTAARSFDEPEILPLASSIHSFPRGPEAGIFLHNLLEWAAKKGFDLLSQDLASIQNHIHKIADRRGWKDWEEVLCNWYTCLVETPLNLNDDTMTLAELSKKECLTELEFMFAAHRVNIRKLDNLIGRAILPKIHRPVLKNNVINGMLKGFIDLVFCHHGRYYVLDYKSNYLGNDITAYGQKAMTKAMLKHRYDLQYVLYTLALHRLLKSRLANYDYQRDVGGAVYLFLRGVVADGRGVFVDKPPWSLIKTLDNLFAGKEEQDDC